MSATIDEQFIIYIVKSLVSKPDAVSIKRTIDEKGVLLELTVDPEDLGRVIGKRGATAQSLRTLLRALGTKNEARYNLKIVDNGVPREQRMQRDDQGTVSEDAWRSPDDKGASEESAVEKASEDVKPETPSEDEMAVKETVEDKGAEEEDDRGSSMAEKTRRELSDLDDLDI